MRRILAALAVLLVAGCGGDGERAPETEQGLVERDGLAGTREKRLIYSPGRVIDQVDALSHGEEEQLAARLDAVDRRHALSAAIVLLKPPEGSSLELVGWAVGGEKPDRQLLMMVDPAARNVRIESAGRLSPEQSAGIAAAVRSRLGSTSLYSALQGGVNALESLARGDGPK